MLNLSARGFCVEWVAALIVLVCGISKDFAIPVSTSHCQVGGLYSFLD
jgi:phosphate/sulfate permease